VSPADPEDGHGADSANVPSTFEEIVAGWRAEGAVPSWPDDHTSARLVPPGDPGSDPRTSPRAEVSADSSENDHFVPPDPPPLPHVGRSALVGVGLLVCGLLLLTTPKVLGIVQPLALPLGLLALASGLVWLVLRSWSGSGQSGDDGDDGAVF
jgi:hypothetical protein